MAEERWLPVAGYDGAYEVSDHGRVRSLIVNHWRGRRMRRAPLLLRPKSNIDGYRIVRFSVDGLTFDERVHLLVLTAFVGPIPAPGMHGAHGDGDPANNRLDNLRWATPLENAADRNAHGRTVRGERQHLAKLTDDDIRQIRTAAGVSRKVLAERYGVNVWNIGFILRGATWKHVA